MKEECKRQRPTQTECSVETSVRLPQVKEPSEAGGKAWNRSFLGKYGFTDIVILDFYHIAGVQASILPSQAVHHEASCARRVQEVILVAGAQLHTVLPPHHVGLVVRNLALHHGGFV